MEKRCSTQLLMLLSVLLIISVCPNQKVFGESPYIIHNEGYLGSSSTSTTRLVFEFNKVDVVSSNYHVIFKLVPNDDGIMATEDVPIGYTDNGNHTIPLQYITLNASNPQYIVPLQIQDVPMHPNIEYTSYFQCYLGGTIPNAKVYVALIEYPQGYVEVVNEKLGYIIRTDFSRDIIVTDSDEYDYFFAYSYIITTPSVYYYDFTISCNNTQLYRKYIHSSEGATAKQYLIPLAIPESVSNVINLRVTDSGDLPDGYYDIAAEIRLYKKLKTSSVDIQAAYKTIGDNTKLPITISYSGPNSYEFQIVNASSNQVLYSSKLKDIPNRIDLQLDFEGDIPLNSRILNTSKIVVAYGNTTTVNKNNILDRAINYLSTNSSQPTFLIINDHDRHFDDNTANQNLIKQIIAKADGIYLIYNDVSQILTQLLEP